MTSSTHFPAFREGKREEAAEAIATKESGPPETVRAFGEVYAFDPATFAVRRDEPTEIVFWNLQGDDEHDAPRPALPGLLRPAEPARPRHLLPERRRLHRHGLRRSPVRAGRALSASKTTTRSR